MIALITGGSGSGKSEYAETLACNLDNEKKMTYIATMYPYGEETLQKIERHKAMRKNKGFETIECFYGLKDLGQPVCSTVLLECMSNLLANELFMEQGSKEKALEEILEGIEKLSRETSNLLIISNDIFSDKIETNPELVNYMKLLGQINREIGKMADVVCEIVYSIPVIHKPPKKELSPVLSDLLLKVN